MACSQAPPAGSHHELVTPADDISVLIRKAELQKRAEQAEVERVSVLACSMWLPVEGMFVAFVSGPTVDFITLQNLLSLPARTKHRTWGDRAFSVAAPTLWNSLPKSIRHCTDIHIFKSLLKTHLFKLAFNV